jgi:integrase
MPRRRTLTERQVANLPRKSKRYSLPDPQQLGLTLRIPPAGPVAYYAVARRTKPFENGRQIWKLLGTSAYLTLSQARSEAPAVIYKIRRNLPLDEPPQDSTADVINKWLQLVVHERGYRSAKEVERVVNKFLLPALGSKPFASVRRSDLIRVLDDVAENSGKSQSDQVLKMFSAISRWWASRNDDYQSPVANVRGLRRGAVVKRDRVLSDDEIRAIWHAADSPEFRLVQFALVCGQRYGKLATLRWDDLDDGTWVIAQDAREKGTAGTLRLPELALQIIARQPHTVGKDFIFGPMHGRTVARLRVASRTSGWTVHDLRRTWRTLASRAGVQTEISERVLGHVVGNAVQQTYDRFQYDGSKQLALHMVVALIERILDPPGDNITVLGAV